MSDWNLTSRFSLHSSQQGTTRKQERVSERPEESKPKQRCRGWRSPEQAGGFQSQNTLWTTVLKCKSCQKAWMKAHWFSVGPVGRISANRRAQAHLKKRFPSNYRLLKFWQLRTIGQKWNTFLAYIKPVFKHQCWRKGTQGSMQK